MSIELVTSESDSWIFIVVLCLRALVYPLTPQIYRRKNSKKSSVAAVIQLYVQVINVEDSTLALQKQTLETVN